MEILNFIIVEIVLSVQENKMAEKRVTLCALKNPKLSIQNIEKNICVLVA